MGPPDPRSTSMAASLGILREAGHSSLNETLKQHNGVTFKLVKTGEYKTFVINPSWSVEKGTKGTDGRGANQIS